MEAAFSALFCLFIAVHSVLSATPSVEKLCPNGAVEIAGPELFRVLDNYCYLFMTYDNEIFGNTQLKCQHHGGSLAMPKTKEINDFLLQGMKQLHQTEPMWIGVQYREQEGALVWEDGEKAQWDNLDDQSRASVADGGKCVVIHPDDARWGAHPCQAAAWYGSRMPFICQYPIQVEDVDQGGTTVKNVGADDSPPGVCPIFSCADLDCGMNGFKLKDGCQLCECN